MLWRPEIFSGTVIVGPAPDGFDSVGRHPLPLPEPLGTEHVGGDDHSAVLDDPAGLHYLSLSGSGDAKWQVVILPLDETAELRLEAIGRFLRRLRGRSGGPLSAGLQLTPQRRTRLIQLLHALDFRLAGASPRDIAAALLDPEEADLPAVEWKSSATRRKANRLISDALALMKGGYRKLLRGG